jgi:hypothetical protein
MIMRYLCKLCLLFFVVSTAHAAEEIALYSADVPVASQSKQDWQQALPTAMQEVLQNVSGQTSLPKLETLNNALKNPEPWVQQYHYFAATKGYTLHVQFDPAGINRLLQQVGIKASGTARPPILVWLAMDTPEGRMIVPNNPSESVVNTLQKSAEKQSLSLLWPELDLQDMNQLNVDQVSAFDIPAITAASKRYQTSVILIGQINQNPAKQWQAQWMLLTPGTKTNWSTSSQEANAMMPSVVNTVAGVLQKQHVTAASAATVSTPTPSVNPSTATENANDNGANPNNNVVTLKITGVNGLDDYAQVVKYVRTLPSITAVDANQVDAEFLVLNVTITGGKATLVQDLSNNDRLVPDQNTDSQDSDVDLVYRWQLGSDPAAPQTKVPEGMGMVTPSGDPTPPMPDVADTTDDGVRP